MASDLQWRTGFGWGAVALLVGASLAAWLLPGPWRWFAAAAALLWGVFMVRRYRQWNGRGWRQVHYRAMLAYAGIAERERRKAAEAGREFSFGEACTELGLLLCGENNRAAVDAILTELVAKQGTFLAGLVERHAADVLPGAPYELRRDLTAKLRGVGFGPQLLIASVIENTHGGVEAARYAVALASGDAE